MRGKVVTCRNATMYPGMLTRGKEYMILGADDKKGVIKLVCDNGRTRLFPVECFDLDGLPVPQLVSWNFYDDPAEAEREDFLCWVEITFALSDGKERWCKLFTPDLLYKVLNQPNVNPPGFFAGGFIIVRSLAYDDIDKVLKDLDDNDDLISASLPINSAETGDG